MRNLVRVLTASVGVLALAGAAQAAPHGVKIGVLTCHVESWLGLCHSVRRRTCTATIIPITQLTSIATSASISKFGVDIGYTSSETILWDVVAPSSDIRTGALQGDYAGATASATVGAGVGAHVLLGGFDKSIALQPLSVEGSTGLDVAAGVGAMSLQRAEPMRASYSYERHAEAAEPQPVEPREEPVAPPPVHRHHIVHHHRAYCPKPQ